MPCPGSKCELYFVCSAVYENNEPPCSSDHESLPTDKQQLKPKMPSFEDVTKDVQFMTVDEGNKAFVVYSNIAQHFGH